MVKPKLSIEDALKIHYRIKNRERKCFLSQEFGVSVSTLNNIEHCKERYKCLKEHINKNNETCIH